MITPTGTGMTQAEYSEAVLDGGAQHIRITFDNGVVLTDQDVEAAGINLNDIINGDTDLTIGRAVSTELTVSLMNSNRMSGVYWNHEFALEMGVDVVEGGVTVTKWVQVGVFQGTRPEKIHYVGVIQFTAHDRMQKFDIAADPYLLAVTYPCTFGDLLTGMCTFAGVPSEAGDELPNIMTRSVTDVLSGKGYTCRNVLAIMAEACGCYARISSAGGLRMTWFTEQTYEVDPAHEFYIDSYDIGEGTTWSELGAYTWTEANKWTWAELGGYKTMFAINGLAVKADDADAGVHYGDPLGNIYYIVGNPFLAISAGTDADTYIEPLYERLSGFSGYLPLSVECVGNWLVEAGDVFEVDVNGDSILTPIFCRTMTWNGFCRDRYEATGSMERQASGSYSNQRMSLNTLQNTVMRLQARVEELEADE